jgi:hypothetical protein
MAISEMKRCRYCQRDLPPTAFYTRRESPDGLSYKCRECSLLYAREARRIHPERGRAARAKYYRKKAAQQGKDVGEYRPKPRLTPEERGKNRSDRMAGWRARNPEKAAAARRRAYEKRKAKMMALPPDERLAILRRYRRNCKRRQLTDAQREARNKKRREYRLKNAAKILAAKRKCYQANPEKYRAMAKRYQACVAESQLREIEIAMLEILEAGQ